MLRPLRSIAVALPFLLAGCGTDITEVPTIEGTTFAASLGVNLATSTKTAQGLYYREVTLGTGATVAGGQQVNVNYTLWLPNGTQLESNSYTFRLGAGTVIQGWDLGIPGMKVGGVRQLIIPPALAYGVQGSGSSIGPNAILVFSVQVVTAQ